MDNHKIILFRQAKRDEKNKQFRQAGLQATIK